MSGPSSKGPDPRDPTRRLQVFYASSNEVKVALSIAEGSNPQYNTSQVSLYEGSGWEACAGRWGGVV